MTHCSITFAGSLLTCLACSVLVSPTLADLGTSKTTQLEQAINSELHLTSSWNTQLHIDATPEQSIRVSIPIDNVSYTLDLEPYSNRADEYQVLMQDDAGELYEVPAGSVRTLRGSIAELGGSVAGASLMEDGLYARIRFADGSEIWMEPVGEKIERAASNTYAFYRTGDIIPSGGTCAADDHMQVSNVLDMIANYKTQSSNRGTIICTAQLGVDTDFEYYQDWGAQTEARINQVVNVINVQYEDEVNLTHEITTIIVRSSSADPYSSSDAGTLLDQFANEWASNQGSIPRDLAHLFTGKNLQNGTIGIAWLGAVCSSVGYGLAESDCCGSLACTTDLSAHEMGHGWGASHQESPAYNTMYPSLQCANLFISNTINEISSFSNSLNCLSCANQAPLGACCVNGGQCLETYQTNCAAGNGTWQGDGTTCATVNCADPEGACCVGGSCLTYTMSDCQNAGGVYSGDNSSCATVSCVEGACCVGTSCSLALEVDCSGSWYGENTNCVDVTCGAGADQLNYELRTWSRSDGQAMETYDLYFPSTDPNTKMVSVFGEDADFLQVRGLSNADFNGTATSVALHQSQFGSDIPHDRQLDAPLGDDVKFDSYVTVGSDDAAIGSPILLGFDSTGFNNATGAYMTNGVWFVTPDDPLALIGSGSSLGHRLISVSIESGQGVEMTTNIQWFDGAGVVHENRNIYWNNLGLGGGPACPTDVDGNGSTDVSDLLSMIGDWGPCSGCATDIDGNGVVNVSDLLEAIGAWGVCQ